MGLSTWNGKLREVLVSYWEFKGTSLSVIESSAEPHALFHSRPRSTEVMKSLGDHLIEFVDRHASEREAKNPGRWESRLPCDIRYGK